MTDLDEIILVAKLAYALREVKSETVLHEDREAREHFYLSRVGVDLRDYIPGLREKLDRKAVQSEAARRSVMQTRFA